MATITWRSLMGNNPDPVRAMTAAQDSFDGMFGSLNSALIKYQDQQKIAETKLKGDNLEKFYADASSRYSTPEAFQAALASGELQGLASSYGDAIDMSKVREFRETRGDVLRQREQDQWKYKDAVEKRNATPFVDDIRSRIAAGDFETANALLAENTLPDEASLYEALKQGQTNATKEAYEAQIRPLELESKRLGLDTSKINKDLNQLNLENVQDQRTVDGALSKAYLAAQGTMMQNGLPNESAMTAAATAATEGMDPRIAAKVLQQARQADAANVQAWRDDQDKNGYVGAVPLNPTAVSSSLEEVIKTIPEDDQESVRAHVNGLVREGVTIPKGTKLPDGSTLEEDMKVPVPFNVARSAILESYGPWYKGGFRRGVSALDIIEQQVKRPEVFMDILTRDRAERLKDSLRNNPDLPSNEKRNK